MGTLAVREAVSRLAGQVVVSAAILLLRTLLVAQLAFSETRTPACLPTTFFACGVNASQDKDSP